VGHSSLLLKVVSFFLSLTSTLQIKNVLQRVTEIVQKKQNNELKQQQPLEANTQETVGNQHFVVVFIKTN
jgi:hypothetical protein